jgi:hypothetical protein
MNRPAREMGVTGLQKFIGFAAIVLTLTVVWVSPASAAPALTVTPANLLVDGQTVHVEGSGFGGSAEVLTCQSIDSGSPKPADCLDGTSALSTASPSGGVSVERAVQVSGFVPSLGRTVNCASERCFVGVAETAAYAATAISIRIAFAPEAVGSITATPSSGLFEGQTVDIEGHGFTGGVDIGFCEVIDSGSPSGNDCLQGTPSLVRSSPSGDFTAQVVVHRSGFVPSLGRAVNCVTGRCYIGVGELEGGGTVLIQSTAISTPITFAPGQPDAMSKRQSDGQIFGDNDYNGAGGRLHRVAAGDKWTYAVLVQNDSTEPDDITVTAPAAPPGVTVHYFVSFFDVASLVNGGGFAYTDMAPGEVRQLAVRFDVDPSTPSGTLVRPTLEFRDAAGASDTLSLGVLVQ